MMTIGLADNLLLSMARAWDTPGETEGSRKIRIIAAAVMKVATWRHLVSKNKIQVLEEDWGVGGEFDSCIELLGPVEYEWLVGVLTGDGLMRDWSELVLFKKGCSPRTRTIKCNYKSASTWNSKSGSSTLPWVWTAESAKQATWRQKQTSYDYPQQL